VSARNVVKQPKEAGSGGTLLGRIEAGKPGMGRPCGHGRWGPRVEGHKPGEKDRVGIVVTKLTPADVIFDQPARIVPRAC